MTLNFAGYGAVYGQAANIGGLFWEEVAPGAFDRVLRERRDVRLLFGHDPNKVLARTANGTAGLSSDRRGLRVRADLIDNTLGRDVAVSLGRGDVDRMSFAWLTERDRWESNWRDGLPLRTLTEVDLIETSIVAWPAYAGTEAGLVGEAEVREGRYQELRRRLLEQRLVIVRDTLSDEERFQVDVAASRRQVARLRLQRCRR